MDLLQIFPAADMFSISFIFGAWFSARPLSGR
jgi:hypothetical protein